MGKHHLQQPKTERNLKLVKDKADLTFDELSEKYDISPSYAKRVYYREEGKLLKKVNNGELTMPEFAGKLNVEFQRAKDIYKKRG